MDNPNNIRISVRLNKKIYDALDEYCFENNTKKGKAIRDGVYLFLAKNKKQANDYQS